MSEEQSPVLAAESNSSGAISSPDESAVATLPSEGTVNITDLEPGKQVTGCVKSVTAFGAFVDLGVGPQGLVHISQLARRRVEKVTDVVKVGDEVQVWVKKVDKKRGRISLTMIKPATVHLRDLELDTVVQGVVTRIEPYGVFIDIGTGRDGMVHISELADGYVETPGAVVSVGDRLEAKVIQVDRKARKVNLSTKDFIKTGPPPEPESAPIPQSEAEEKSAASIMELAFQASLQRTGSGKRERGLERLIARSLKR